MKKEENVINNNLYARLFAYFVIASAMICLSHPRRGGADRRAPAAHGGRAPHRGGGRALFGKFDQTRAVCAGKPAI